MLSTKRKNKSVKNIQKYSQSNTEMRKNKNISILKNTFPQDFNDIKKAVLKNPTHISIKNSTKWVISSNQLNRKNNSKKKQIGTSQLEINTKNNNLIYLNENYPKSNNIRNTLKSFTNYNNFQNIFSVDKKYQNLIHEKNNDINLLQNEIEYYKKLIQDNKYTKSSNNKCVLPKNGSGVFLSTVLFNKTHNPKIAKGSSLYLKNTLSYEKEDNLKLLLNNNIKPQIKKKNRIFKSKENQNYSNQLIGNYTDLKLKKNSNTITTSNMKRNNYLNNTKSCDSKKKYCNPEKDILIIDYGSINNNIKCLSPDHNISNDIALFNDLKVKKFTKSGENFYKKDNRNNKTINSIKNSSKNVNSISEFMEEYSSNNCFCMEKCEDIMVRMGKLFNNLFSMVKLPKKFNEH